MVNNIHREPIELINEVLVIKTPLILMNKKVTELNSQKKFFRKNTDKDTVMRNFQVNPLTLETCIGRYIFLSHI